MTGDGCRVAVVMVGALVGAAFHRTLGWAAVTGWAVGAASTAGLLVAAAQRRRSLLLAVVAPVAVPTAVIGVLVVPEVAGLPRDEAVTRAVAVVTGGWSALLRDPTPVAVSATTLIPVLVLTWVSTFLGSLALVARAAVAPIVPLWAGLAIAVLYGHGGLGPALLVPALAVGPTVWLLTARAPVPAGLARRAALAAGLSALAVVVGPLLPLVDRQPPFDLRTLLDQTTTVPPTTATPTTTTPPPPTVAPPEVTGPAPGQSPPTREPAPPTADDRRGLRWWWSLLVVPLAVPAAKALRRFRRAHAPTVAARTVGAWREAADRLVEWGVRPPARATAPALLAPWSASELGDAAEAAAFGVAPAGTDASAWELLRRLERNGGWRARWHRWLDPRPLWRRW